MTASSLAQPGIFLALLLLLAWPLGIYMARVFGDTVGSDLPRALRIFAPLERGLYRLAGVDATREQHWTTYALSILLFNGLGLVFLYLLLRLQGLLPLNPEEMAAVQPDTAFNTSTSFVSNTNWQGYGGESTLSYLTQMLGLTVQNVLSCATGIAVCVALLRGLARRRATTIGNAWVDLTRATVYVLLPLSIVLTLLLVSQGVVQTFNTYETTSGFPGLAELGQVLALGPAASQVAVKMLGTNGGGFFNANSAHPFENPTAFSNLLEMLAILLIPAALTWTFGRMVRDARQGYAVLATMLVIFVVLLGGVTWAEQAGNPLYPDAIDQEASAEQAGGNMEGKEARFGITQSTIFAASTTAASNGAVNSMHDAYTPLGGLVPLFLMMLGEVIFGGAGSGLYGMLVFVIIAVFFAGLMIGRTPEYLGKKVGPFEIKMATLVILIPPLLVLTGTALALSTGAGRAGIQEAGVHGYSEVLYAWTSMANNNGSAFAGMNANLPFTNYLGGMAMLLGRFWLIIPVLALAGSFVRKQAVPVGPGTLPTHTPLFVVMLIGVVIIVGALTYFPALALGPLVEHLIMDAGKVTG